MKVKEFRLKLEKECERQGLPKPETTEERLGSIKLRINLERNAHIDLYCNEDTGTITSALVVNKKRVFGINGYPRRERWHLHPTENAQRHIRIEPMTLERMIEEYVNILRKLKIKRL